MGTELLGTDLSFRTAASPRASDSPTTSQRFPPTPRSATTGTTRSSLSRQAAEEIRDFTTDARIVILLRNPVDQMYSQHSEMLYQGDEDIRDFAEALAAEDDRALGRRIPAGCRKPFALQYRAVARYCNQVDRYFSTFGRGPRLCGRVRRSRQGHRVEPIAGSSTSYRSIRTTNRSSGW